MKDYHRREFIKLVGAGFAAMYFGGCTSSGKKADGEYESIAPEKVHPKMQWIGPVNRKIGYQAPRTFSGDQPDRAHQILWDKARFISSHGGRLPDPREEAEVVVVGGGMSGLLSTYFLKDKKVILLEQGERFGGNARAESWGGIDYSLATAYIVLPRDGSPITPFLKEIGMDKKMRVSPSNDPIFVDGKRYDNVWEEGTVPESRKQFRALAQHFTDVLHNANGQKFPDVPIAHDSDRSYVEGLDRITFKEYLEKVLEEPLHPHVEQLMEHYFWSAAAASYSELSAAAGLSAFAADFEGMMVAPGGNGAIAEAILSKILDTVPEKQIRNSSLVIDVRTLPSGGALVSYVDSEGYTRTIKTQYVILACPKFVVAKVLEGIESERLQAIRTLQYRSYLVANVLIDQKVQDQFYDLYFFQEKNFKIKSVKDASCAQRATDVVYGNYAKPHSQRTVLTVFRPMPYDGARAEIYAKNAYDKYRSEFEEQIYQSILPTLKISKESVVDIRLARWGHPLPVSQVGNIASGKIDLLRKPFQDRVFFVEQDNWTFPSFETAFHEATHWTTELRKRLGTS